MTVATALVLAVLGVVLAGPAPSMVAAARWPLRAPRAALVLWQSVALAAVLSVLGAGLATASLLLVPGAASGWLVRVPLVAVLLLTALIGARLGATVLRVGLHTRSSRERHRDLVDLLDTADVPELYGRAEDLRVLPARYPLAYCLPGLRPRVVVSDTTLRSLQPEELRGVLAHERAHLRARHDLVLEAFLVLHHAFPRGVRSRAALRSVSLLVELLADDVAVSQVGRPPLARALVACAGAGAPAGAMAAGGTDTLLRVQRLGRSQAPATGAAVLAYLASTAVLVVPTVVVAVPWITQTRSLIGL